MSMYRQLLISSLLTLCVISAQDQMNIGSTIPDLEIRLLNGEKTTIHQLTEDGPLMIDFWATWCVPCKKVMKFLDQYHQEYAEQDFKVLMINTDSPRSMAKVKSYVRSQQYQFIVGLDPNKMISKKLNGMVMPTLILVDKGGEVKWRHTGYTPGEEAEIKKQIKTLLDNQIEKIEKGNDT
jgi:thiol-disulfide isomerase/thioredoxin